jgi:hypothetical protein
MNLEEIQIDCYIRTKSRLETENIRQEYKRKRINKEERDNDTTINEMEFL